MNLLLDSHTLLWLMESNPKLSDTARRLLADPMNELYLSIASIWEIGIKSGLGKMGLSVPYTKFLDTAINGYGLIVLPITMDDCVRYESMPFPNKQHHDPFDRMIIIHAQREGLAIIGVDSSFDYYDITRIW